MGTPLTSLVAKFVRQNKGKPLAERMAELEKIRQSTHDQVTIKVISLALELDCLEVKK